MTWLQILAQAGIIASILGAAIAISAYFNGKHIKEGISKVLEKMDKGFREMDKGFREIGKKMDEGFREMSREMNKGFRKMDELAEKRHKEVLLFLKKVLVKQ